MTPSEFKTLFLKAIQVIRYYGDKSSWVQMAKEESLQSRIWQDTIHIEDCEDKVGGMRARQYIAEIDELPGMFLKQLEMLDVSKSEMEGQIEKKFNVWLRSQIVAEDDKEEIPEEMLKGFSREFLLKAIKEFAVPLTEHNQELSHALKFFRDKESETAIKMVEMLKDNKFKHRYRPKDELELEIKELRKALDWTTSGWNIQTTVGSRCWEIMKDYRKKFGLDSE